MPDPAAPVPPQEPGAATRLKILTAARKVFAEKGHDGARMREIAKEAGVNLALMNYHFGSKEALFLAVYREAFLQIRSTAFHLLNSELPLEERVRQLLQHILGSLAQQPELPVFVFREMHRTGGAFLDTLPPLHWPAAEGLLHLVEPTAAASGQSRTLLALSFMLLAASMGLLPFLLRPLVQHMLRETGESFDDFLRVWQAQAVEVLRHRGTDLAQPGSSAE